MTAITQVDEESSLIKQLFPIDSTLGMKSEISPGLVLPMARARIVARMTKSVVLDGYINELLQLLVSKDRRGRHELLEALGAMRHHEEDEGM
jgi:hypothetical protein